MKRFDQRPPKAIYLALMFSMFIVGCDSGSSGAKETEQLDNDNDPTQVEITGDQNRALSNQNPNLSNNANRLDERGEFVVINDFNESDWQQVNKDFNLESVEASSRSNITSTNLGADSWKPWENYHYRVIYFTDNGALKAKPQLRSRDNQDIIDISNQSLDSLKLEGLWEEIQKDMSNTTNRLNKN